MKNARCIRSYAQLLYSLKVHSKLGLANLNTSVVLVSIRHILLVIVLFLESILESSLVLVLGGSNTCK